MRLALFEYGFRPFFMLTGWLAVFALAAWVVLQGQSVTWTNGFPVRLWHGHEMIFGFIGAAIAGFMLTAVPSWTGSRGFAGRPLALLVLAWLLGRVAFAAAGTLPFPATALLELAFLPGLMVLLAPTLIRAQNRNTRLLFVLFAFWCADAAFLWGLYHSNPAMAVTSLQFALNLVLLLITIIGGRIVPAFTANALRQNGVEFRMRNWRSVEIGVIATMVIVLVGDVVAASPWFNGTAAFAAGILHSIRLSGWNGHRTLNQPIVWILHVAYLWLPVGFFLKAAWLLMSPAWAAFWMHALSAGAAATMILAVMSRASLGHTGRPLRVAPIMVMAYLLLPLSVVIRVFGPAWFGLGYRTNLLLAGALWIGSFLIFSIVYSPILLKPRADGKPG